MSVKVLEDMRKAIIEYDAELAVISARKVIEEHIDPVDALDVITEAIRHIGDGYGKGELFLPDLVGASQAMSSAMPIIEEELKRMGKQRKSLGVVVIGTVYGDIHTIGKTMVGTLLSSAGFSVHDVGISVKPEDFVEAVKKYNPDILAMSALMTTTAPEQKRTIEALKAGRIRDSVKVIVGGGAITQEFANTIGADGYAAIAPMAVPLAKKLVGKRDEGASK
jgi:methanogenic corrinoid protein MtbC1